MINTKITSRDYRRVPLAGIIVFPSGDCYADSILVPRQRRERGYSIVTDLSTNLLRLQYGLWKALKSDPHLKEDGIKVQFRNNWGIPIFSWFNQGVLEIRVKGKTRQSRLEDAELLVTSFLNKKGIGHTSEPINQRKQP